MFGAPLKMLAGYLPPQQSLDFDLNRIINQNINSNLNNNISICDKPKYSDKFTLPHNLTGYFDYQQGLQCAKKLNKPIFIDFTGHGCVNCREMEARVWADPRVIKRLKENFVIIALYVDDKTELPKNEWTVSQYNGKTINTIGKKYADFQISKFQVNAQPYYVILDTNENILIPPKVYDLNVDNFIKFLDDAIIEFNKKISLQ